MNDEEQFIQWLRQRITTGPAIQLGVGDDAALVNLNGQCNVVVTTDLIAEGTHFTTDTEPELIGRKALAINLSDLAAMTARPIAATVSLLINRNRGFGDAQRIMEGMLSVADTYDVCIAGGDTNVWAQSTVVSVTALGCLDGRLPLRRDRALPGDAIVVTGTLGGSLEGKHLSFQPRVREAIAIAARWPLRAGMDISDGLALDLSRMARASGCGAIIELDRVPISDAARELAAMGPDRPAIERALSDGEDFELLLAVPQEAVEGVLTMAIQECPLTRIGTFTDQSGLWCRGTSGLVEPLSPMGFIHR